MRNPLDLWTGWPEVHSACTWVLSSAQAVLVPQAITYQDSRRSASSTSAFQQVNELRLSDLARQPATTCHANELAFNGSSSFRLD